MHIHKLHRPLLLFFLSLFIFSGNLISQEIKTVTIGDQVWMKHNLQTDVLGSICYDKDSLNCQRYGRLYCWQAALDACPEGFRLPTDDDWTILSEYLGGDEVAGGKLRKGGETGFDVILAGNYHPEVKIFSFKNEKAYFWTASSFSYHTAWIRSFGLGQKNINRTTIGKSFYFSIRCIKIED